jgi:hypothetical protein
MRSIAFLALLGSLIFGTTTTRAAQTPDSTLTLGIQTCISNGLESGLRVWYADQPKLGTEMVERINQASAGLGALIDAELVTIQPVSKRVSRYYIALYFARSPLWVRIERYESRDKAYYFPLKCSVQSDDILPGYVTQFTQ